MDLFCVIRFVQGWKMASKKTSFLGLKKLKTSKVQNLCFYVFWVKFYTNHIKFHILLMICEYLLYFTENALKETELGLCIGCSLGGNFMSSLTLKSKKPKNLRTFFKLGFSSPGFV